MEFSAKFVSDLIDSSLTNLLNFNSLQLICGLFLLHFLVLNLGQMIGLFYYIQLLYPFEKNREESMGVLTKEEIEELLSRALKENEKLRKEIVDLTLIAADANAKVKLANDIALKSQKMFNDLFEIVKTQYDSEFNLDDIQKRLSV